MPAEVGYGTTINLAAELTRPPQQPTQVARSNEPETREPPRVEDKPDDTGKAFPAEDRGNVTAERGQNLNITA